MKYVKWIFVVLLSSSLTSYVGKSKAFSGLNVGDVAPSIELKAVDALDNVRPTDVKPHFDLSTLRGKYVVLSFWASYDANSRIRNIQLSNMLKSCPNSNIEMISISYDLFESVFREALEKDGIVASQAFIDLGGSESSIYKKYNLDRGFNNYLLDENGVILAKNISVSDLALCSTMSN